jgi:Pro-kumamolisin, activation domain
MPGPSGYEPLPGSERPQLPGSTRVGPVGKSERVAVTLLLRLRPDAPPEPDFEHWQNTPPGQREFLSAEEYMQTYSSSDRDVRAVTEFLESSGLRVTEASAGRRRIVAEGDAAKIDAAFAVRLINYRAPRTHIGRLAPRPEGTPDLEHTEEDVVYRGFEGPVQLPSELIGVVETVIGLDNRQLGQPGGTGTGDPPDANYLSPVAVAQLYDFPNTGAAGQTIGIFEDAGAGAAYSHTDIADFISSLPAGYNSQPSLADIGLTVGATTYTNQTALVTSSPGGAVGECTIDVSIAAAVAQGANINVYFSDASEQGWEAFFDRAINPPAGDNPPSALTNSWFSIFGDDPGQIGDPSASGSIAQWMHTKLRSAHTRGITVFMAIGDWGSADQIADGNCHVAYPHSDTAVTACGGTIVGNISPTGFEEFAWSEANTASQFQNFPYESTGGGVSDNPGFPVPHYQKAAGVLPVSKNDGNARRGVPDVAGMVAMDGFFFAGQGGPGRYGFFGTSLVAPLYAGLTAVINAFLGRSTGFLNPTLYRHGPAICHDVRFGNNDSGNAPDAPAYVAGPGWDACTGWGSIDGSRLRAALAPAPIIVTALAGAGDFGHVCLNSFADQILTINNTGFSLLLISDITSSSAAFVLPSVASYPLAIGPGEAMDIVIRFQPTGLGPSGATLTIYSNDLNAPHIVPISGVAPSPRLVLAMADSGNMGAACTGSFVDEPLILNNSGACLLSVTDITSSSAEFQVPQVTSYPLSIGPGESVAMPIRFAPASVGPASATLTIISNDPASPASIAVTGEAPSGRLAVTGSTFFGGVKACRSAERTISICNVGDCKLHVSSVRFRHPRRHWELVNNPFPAALHPGSCLSVVIRYKATERIPRSCDLIIDSDDPATPVRVLEVLAYTIWPEGCCRRCCDSCRKEPCERRHCEPSCCRECREERDFDEADLDQAGSLSGR